MTSDAPVPQAPARPLVLLAAGAGSRFGGEKPLAVVGPAGETLVDLTISDATLVGYDPVVIVASARNQRALRSHVNERHEPSRLRWVVQGTDEAPLGRVKPWGTVHAVVSAASLLPGAFAVANADDHYGLDALRAPAQAMTDAAARGDHDVDHLVTYPWRQTMPPSGTANRGVCTIDRHGQLVGIEERRNLTAASPLDPSAQVSMNLWGFGRSALTALSGVLDRFLVTSRDDPDAELTIPDAVATLLRQGRTVLVHPRGEHWIGITYPEDVPWARERLRALRST